MVENSTSFSRVLLKKLTIFGDVLASAVFDEGTRRGLRGASLSAGLGENGNPAPKREGRRQCRDNSFEQDAMTSVW